MPSDERTAVALEAIRQPEEVRADEALRREPW